MPIGIYQKVDKLPSRGDTVAVCLPKAAATEGLAKGYLLPGYCPSKMLPVLKTLIAVPNDKVVTTEQFILVNNKKYLAPQQPGVKHFVSEHSTSQYWLYGKNNPTRSWDSRYFAGVKRENIVGVYRPVFVFKRPRPLSQDRQ